MKISRRTLIKGGVMAGAGALLGSEGTRLMAAINQSEQDDPAHAAYALCQPENILYSACLQCNTQCTVKAKIQNGLLVKIDGNPYSPMNMQPQVSYDLSPQAVAKVDGHLCPKGQSGVQTIYDPYRIRMVLKRSGPRGSSKWKAIPFDQAIKEIAEGGKLFAEIGEDRQVPGFKEVFALRDADLAKTMGDDAAAIRGGKMTVDEFKEKHKDHLDVLIDPNHPDLGPKNNQFIFQGGRIGPDREMFAKRFTFAGLGSVNWYAHTTICEQAHHVAFLWSTAQWEVKDGKGGWNKGANHMKPDYTQAEFVIFWGTGYTEANFGPTPMGPQVSQAIVDGKLKIAVVDPRLSKTAAKGWWIPVRPGGDLALAFGMLRWTIENKRYDEAFLRNANKGAAKAGGEKSWSNSTWLVNAENGKLLRAKDLGIGDENQFVVLVAGQPVPVTPDDEKSAVVGDLDAGTSLGGLKVKTGFQALKESVFVHDMAYYAEKSGVDQKSIEDLAREFTAHGKKAAIDFYRGPIKVTYGYYAAQAIIALNLLIGNIDHTGGFAPGGGAWDAMGGKPGKPFEIGKMHPGALKPFGVKLTRESSGPYESSTIFTRDGYPAKRPWFPFTDDVYQEIIPAAYAGYPYPIKILWLHYGTPALSSPAGHLQIKMLQDTSRLPLFISTDIVLGETSMFADYVFPDIAYLERWGNPLGTSPVTLTKTTKIRQPVVAPIPEIVSVEGEEMPISMDAVMIAVAQKIKAPGYGKDGLGAGYDFKRPEQFYLKMVANVAWGEKEGEAVAAASAQDMALFVKARRHLPKGVFDLAKWQAAVGNEWSRVVTVLNHGGRFEAADKAHDGAFLGHPWGKQMNLYVEPIGSAKHSVTGKPLSGVPVFQEMASFDGKPALFPAEYDLDLFTYKEIWGGQSRTSGNYAGQMALMPENYVYLNALDARRLGLADYDLVRLVSPSFTGAFELAPGVSIAVEGKVKVIQGIRPGAVAVSWSYGHWAYGAKDVTVNGQVIKGEAARARGLVPNPAMGVDGYLKDVCLTDPIAGDAAYSGTRIKLVKSKSGAAERGALPKSA